MLELLTVRSRRTATIALTVVALMSLVLPAASLAGTVGAEPAPASSLALPVDCASGDATGPLPVGSASISGTVGDANGGIGGIRVYLESADGTGRSSVDTQAGGSWSITGLGAGAYVVSYFDPSHTYQAGFYASSGLVVDGTSAEVLSVSTDDVTDVSVVLPANQVVQVSGRVTEGDGLGVQGIEVSATSRDFPMSSCATTDLNGDYTIDVWIGTYAISVNDPNGTQPSGFYAAGAGGNFTDDFDGATPVVADTSVAGINIQFPAVPLSCGSGDSAGPLPQGAFSLEGTVTDGSAGLPGIRVYVESTVAGGRGSTTTAEDGSWRLDGLGASSYQVSFFDDAGAYQSGFYSTGGLQIEEVHATDVTVSTADATGIDVVLPPESLVTMSGRILQSNGDPAVGVHVDGSSRAFPLNGCDRTDATGSYSFDVRTGTYAISFSDPADVLVAGLYLAGAPGNYTNRYSLATLVVADSTQAVPDIQLPPTYAITGTVTNGTGGALEGISVVACSAGEPENCRSHGVTDEFGSFVVTRVVADSYIVRVDDSTQTYRGGYRQPDGTVGASAATAEVITVSSANVAIGATAMTVRNARLSGQVTDTNNLGVPDIAVQVCDANWIHCSDVVTGLDGAYETGGLPPGSYNVFFYDPSGQRPSGYYGPADTTQPVMLTRSAEDARLVAVADLSVAGIDIVLPDTYRISGTISVSGVPVPYQYVAVCSQATGAYCGLSASTDESGAFVSEPLLAGTYFLSTYGDSGENLWYVEGGPASRDAGAATPVTVTDADVTDVAFDATPPVGVATEPGQDVTVAPTDSTTGSTPVSLTFDEVTGGGETTLTVSDTGPATPSGFQLGDPPTYYDIETTATFTGQVQICISYDDTSFTDETLLRLLHFDTTTETWEDTTVSHDLTANVICGLTDSFSPFAVGQRVPSFGGFLSPVDGDGVVNAVKAGRAVPVTFSLGGDFGLDILALGSPTSQRTACEPAEETDAIEETVTAGSSELSYDAATDTYTYVWKTDKTWAGHCRELTVTFNDGTTEEAQFKFTK